MSYLCDLLLNSQAVGFSHLKPSLISLALKRKVLLVLIYSRNTYFFYYEAQIYYNGFQIPKEKLFQPDSHIDNVFSLMALKCRSQKLNLKKKEKNCLKLVSYSMEVICVRCCDMVSDHPVCVGLKTAPRF